MTDTDRRQVQALILDAADDVAIAICDLVPGTAVRAQAGAAIRDLPVLDAVPAGHKLSLRDIGAGSQVRKYGEVIGRTTTAIAAGRHVHVHNLSSLRAIPDRTASSPAFEMAASAPAGPTSLKKEENP